MPEKAFCHQTTLQIYRIFLYLQLFLKKIWFAENKKTIIIVSNSVKKAII